MEILYKNRKLAKCAEDEVFSRRNLGTKRSELYILRIGDMMASETMEDLRYLPGHYHELTGNRKGQWACDLDQPYRLIFEPQEKPIPEDEYGSYLWIKIKAVEILDINNYHGK